MKKYLTIILAFMFGILSMCAITLGAGKPSAPLAYANGEDNGGAKLLYNPKAVAAAENKVFVFDEYEGLIKTYTASTSAQNVTTYSEDESSSIAAENVLKMEVCDNYLFVLSNETSQTISVYYIPNLSTNKDAIGSKSAADANSLENMFNFATFKSGNDIYIVASVFVSGANINKFYVLNFKLDSSPAPAFTTNIAEYTPNLLSQTQISSLVLAPNEDDASLLNLVFAMGSKVYNFSFNPTTLGSTSQETTQTLELTENVLSLNRIKKEEHSYVVVATASGLKLYSETTSGGYSLSNVSTTAIDLSSECYFGDNGADLYIANTTDKQIVKYSLNNSDPVALSGETLVENGIMNIEAISAQNLEFFRVTSASAVILESPFSQNTIKTLNINDYVVRVKKITFGNNELLDYHYCLFVGNNSNTYGYIKAEFLTKLNPTSPPKTTILINNESNIYSLPSTFVDITNTKTTTTSITQATMLSSGVYSQNSQKAFYLVKIKVNGSDEFGFVETDREYVSSGSKRLVNNNATTLKETIVYDDDADDAEIIDQLEKGARVKINDGQKTNAKYVKITYSDSNGIERTGYVLSENLKTDSWSVLRIIGLVLVGLNVIFLIVLFSVKKRINHD